LSVKEKDSSEYKAVDFEVERSNYRPTAHVRDWQLKANRIRMHCVCWTLHTHTQCNCKPTCCAYMS